MSKQPPEFTARETLDAFSRYMHSAPTMIPTMMADTYASVLSWCQRAERADRMPLIQCSTPAPKSAVTYRMIRPTFRLHGAEMGDGAFWFTGPRAALTRCYRMDNGKLIWLRLRVEKHSSTRTGMDGISDYARWFRRSEFGRLYRWCREVGAGRVRSFILVWRAYRVALRIQRRALQRWAKMTATRV